MTHRKPIRLFLTDVDGCLTDGGMYYSANGDELKRFCVYDGMGMVQLRAAGIACGILTSEKTPIVVHRARKLGLDYLYMGVGRKMEQSTSLRYAPAHAEPTEQPAMTKLEAAQLICQERGLTLEEVCFVGDDINDIDLLRQVGLAACPNNAREEVKQIPNILCLPLTGGNGAIRYLCDYILS